MEMYVCRIQQFLAIGIPSVEIRGWTRKGWDGMGWDGKGKEKKKEKVRKNLSAKTYAYINVLCAI